MSKFFSLLLIFCMTACNNKPQTTSSKDGTPKDSATAKVYTWTKEEEGEFLSGCVDSAKLKLGEAAAFVQCKCMLSQLKQNFPSMDSAAPALMDVKQVARLAAKCK
jgi:hypothetical protein